MNTVSHFFLGWMVANTADFNWRERMLVTFAGVAPDLDGLGIIVERSTMETDDPLLWFTNYHHVLGHNIFVALALTVLAFVLARQRWRTASLVFASFHVHLLADLIGGKGPDGVRWAIYYLYPLLPTEDRYGLNWTGMWELNDWRNFLISIYCIVLTFYLAWKRGYSPVGIFSERSDAAFVATLRCRFGEPGVATSESDAT